MTWHTLVSLEIEYEFEGTRSVHEHVCDRLYQINRRRSVQWMRDERDYEFLLQKRRNHARNNYQRVGKIIRKIREQNR
jgi:hypothetical protein